jgi:hypothetical protein
MGIFFGPASWTKRNSKRVTRWRDVSVFVVLQTIKNQAVEINSFSNIWISELIFY